MAATQQRWTRRDTALEELTNLCNDLKGSDKTDALNALETLDTTRSTTEQLEAFLTLVKLFV